MESAINVAMKKAGLVELKEEQRECLQRFLEGHDVFGSLPTGYGKSLIYGLLPESFNYIRGIKLSFLVLITISISAVLCVDLGIIEARTNAIPFPLYSGCTQSIVVCISFLSFHNFFNNLSPKSLRLKKGLNSEEDVWSVR